VEAGACVYAVGSGRYEFSTRLPSRPLNGCDLPAAGSR
jgi:hypothetical protein